MPDFFSLTTAIFVVDWVIRIGLSLRVILGQKSVSISLAWLTVILIVPFVGGLLYLLVGERRLGRKRLEKHAAVVKELTNELGAMFNAHTPGEACSLSATAEMIRRQALAATQIPALRGNMLQLIDDSDETLRSIVRDIDAAKEACHLEFYIWNEGGTADEVVEALIKASGRGVACRLVLDALGSKKFLASGLCARLRDAGVEVVESLPVGIIRLLVARLDLRNHRKIVAIDDRVGYTGSQNLAEAGSFAVGSRKGAGPWVDTMVRVEGPVVSMLNAIFVHDYRLDGGVANDVGDCIRIEANEVHDDDAVIHVIPSGPGVAPEAIHRILLGAVYAARRELIITTPYFIPDEAMLSALGAAADRGVQVTLVLPKRVDSILVRVASRSYFQPLLDAGVRITEFRDGLLHSKTLTVDGEFALIGSVNLDMRSFFLNYEITLVVYDQRFTAQLRDVQLDYAARADDVDPAKFARRRFDQRLFEGTARLLSPVL